MRSSRRFKRVLLILALLVLVGAAFSTLAAPEMTRCYLVKWSTLNRIAPDLYVDPNVSETQKKDLRQRVTASKERVSTLFGGFIAAPVIIAGHTMDV